MADPTPQPAIRSNDQRFVDFVLTLVIALPVLAGSFLGSNALSRHLCPPDTFLSGTSVPNLKLVAVLLLALSTSYLITRGLIWLFPALGRYAGYPASYGDASWLSGWPRIWLYAAGAGALAGTLLLFAVSLTEFCLTDSTIFYRQDLLSVSKSYPWRDVAAIQAACRRGARGHWNAVYLLVLSDGPSIDLLTSEPDFRDGYGPLVRAVRGRSIPFYAGDVVSDCGHMEADLLRRPPG